MIKDGALICRGLKTMANMSVVTVRNNARARQSSGRRSSGQKMLETLEEFDDEGLEKRENRVMRALLTTGSRSSPSVMASSSKFVAPPLNVQVSRG